MLIPKEELINLIESGSTQKDIAKRYSIQVHEVKDILRYHNLKTKCILGGSKGKDLTGTTFGYLYVEGIDSCAKYGKKYLCKCSLCNNYKIIRGSTLTAGKVKSCGCRRGKSNIGKLHTEQIKKEIGKIYNGNEIISFFKKEGQTGYYVNCKCSCGKLFSCRSADLKNGRQMSCGCYGKERQSENGALYGSKNCTNYFGRKWYFIKNGENISCRSSYEVFYANFLINNNIDFEYEPKVFKIKNRYRYTPDFYLKESNIYIEIKGRDKESQKWKREIFKIDYNLKLIGWEDLRLLCNLKFKCLNSFFEEAKRLNIDIIKYMAEGLYYN